MDSSWVIKVEYGETLRRFKARVVDGKLSLNMDGLRDKICQLFNFAADTELTLTYIDEDDDVVTLADEEDLQDVTEQNLYPLRLSVRLNLEKNNRSISATSSGNSAGVTCDGCGVHPITGLCFEQRGNDAGYVRMDFPVTYHHPSAFEHGGMRSSTVPQVSRGCVMKPGQPKLDSCFIQDVTSVAPLTPFTKIWRMRNNGDNVWPKGTRLIWSGGDKLSDAFSVELQITSVGLAVDQEFDVAADFIAPEVPGKYISYWRMASPSGHAFGQHVLVLIQVDAFANQPKKELYRGASQDLNLERRPSQKPEVEKPTNQRMPVKSQTWDTEIFRSTAELPKILENCLRLAEENKYLR